MPRKQLVPSYRLHKPSGLARAIVDGKHVYLGVYGSEESRVAYAKLIAELVGNPLAQLPPSRFGDQFPDISINEMLVRYLDFAREHYSKDGKPTKEHWSMTDAITPLRPLFSHLPAREFGPLKLKVIQAHLVEEGRKCRTEVNRQIKRIRRVFGWAVGEELVPPSVHAALKEVKCLRRGKTKATEAEKVMPVPDAVVEATMPFLSPQIAALVRIQRASGARPGEIVIMRPIDIDMTDDVWLYRPTDHKNAWRELPRLITLGPQSQAAIRPFLNRPPEAFLFSPAEAEAWRNEQRALHRNPNRKTRVFPCELRARVRRKQASRSRKAKRPKRERYDVDSYRRGIHYGIIRANRELAKRVPKAEAIPHWHPYQLRHTAGTALRKRFGAEAVPLGLGNSIDLLELYAERDLEKLKRISREVG
jgi:integrase